MALGYCAEPGCDRLVAIVAREHKHPGSRERAWYPVPHTHPNGKPCRGVKKAL